MPWLFVPLDECPHCALTSQIGSPPPLGLMFCMRQHKNKTHAPPCTFQMECKRREINKNGGKCLKWFMLGNVIWAIMVLLWAMGRDFDNEG